MLRYFIAGLLVAHCGLFAHDEYFQSIIANTPKNVTGCRSYNTYIVDQYGRRICIASYPCNSQLSGYLAKGDIHEIFYFLDEGKLGLEVEWFEAILDFINLRNLPRIEFDYEIFLSKFWSDFNLWRKFQDRYNAKKAERDKKFAKKWQKECQQKIEERNAAMQQRKSQYIDRRLNALKKELVRRIKRIEYQLEKKHRYDHEFLACSGACLAVTGILSYVSYREYHMAPYYCKTVLNDWGAFAAISLFLTGITFAIACNPNRDNEYLPKYKKLLGFIKYLEKHGYDGWRSKNRIADKDLIAQ